MPKLLEAPPPNTNGNPAKIARNYSIVQARLQGKSYKDIAAEHNISFKQVGNILNDDKELRAILETGARELISLVPSATANYYDLLKSANEKVKLEASRDVLDITGIRGKHTENPIINQYLQINVQGGVDPSLSQAFSQCFGELEADTEVIEAEFNETQVNTETT